MTFAKSYIHCMDNVLNIGSFEILLIKNLPEVETNDDVPRHKLSE